MIEKGWKGRIGACNTWLRSFLGENKIYIEVLEIFLVLFLGYLTYINSEVANKLLERQTASAEESYRLQLLQSLPKITLRAIHLPNGNEIIEIYNDGTPLYDLAVDVSSFITVEIGDFGALPMTHEFPLYGYFNHGRPAGTSKGKVAYFQADGSRQLLGQIRRDFLSEIRQRNEYGRVQLKHFVEGSYLNEFNGVGRFFFEVDDSGNVSPLDSKAGIAQNQTFQNRISEIRPLNFRDLKARELIVFHASATAKRRVESPAN